MAEIAGREFWVGPDVLIPRVETEKLCQLVAWWGQKVFRVDSKNSANLAKFPARVEIFEVGCGSGAVSVTLAKMLPGVQIVGSDISRAALAIAEQNVATHQVGAQVRLTQSDLLAGMDFAAFPPADEFGIVANLPYIPTKDYLALETSVREFEPRLALDGGADGFDLIRRLLAQASSLARLPRAIFLEVDPSHDLSFVSEFDQFAWRQERDINGLARYLIGESVL